MKTHVRIHTRFNPVYMKRKTYILYTYKWLLLADDPGLGKKYRVIRAYAKRSTAIEAQARSNGSFYINTDDLSLAELTRLNADNGSEYGLWEMYGGVPLRKYLLSEATSLAQQFISDHFDGLTISASDAQACLCSPQFMNRLFEMSVTQLDMQTMYDILSEVTTRPQQFLRLALR